MADQAQMDQHGAAQVVAQLADRVAGNHSAEREVLVAAANTNQIEPSVRTRSGANHLSLRRLRSKPTSTKKKGVKRKVKKPRVEGPLNSSREWSVVEDGIDPNASYMPNIPCRQGCGLTFDTLRSADEHVKSIHSAPRVDQIPSLLFGTPQLQPRNVVASNNAQPSAQSAAQWTSSSAPPSPTPFNPHPCTLCANIYANQSDLTNHMSRRHPPVASVRPAMSCPLGCSDSFNSEAEFVAHIVSIHNSPSQAQGSLSAPHPIPTSGNLPSFFSGLSLNQGLGTNSTHLSSLAQPSLLTRGAQNSYQNSTWGSGPWAHQMKSGQDRLSHHHPRVNVHWPHECVDAILAKRSYAYNDLSGSALAAGCIASLFRTSEYYQSPEAMEVYLQHISFLFHCLSYSNNVPAILEFHASILGQIEAGLLTWSKSHEQTFTLQRLNFRSGLKEIQTVYTGATGTNDKKNKEEENKRKAEAERTVCADYGEGKCTQSGDHGGKRHVCFFCWWKRNWPNTTHSSKECTYGPKKK